MLNKPATAREKIHMNVFPPTDGITCFDGTKRTLQRTAETCAKTLQL